MARLPREGTRTRCPRLLRVWRTDNTSKSCILVEKTDFRLFALVLVIVDRYTLV
jgi:hypothetical protein